MCSKSCVYADEYVQHFGTQHFQCFLFSATDFTSLGFNNPRDGSFFAQDPKTLDEFRTEFAKALEQKVTTILIAGTFVTSHS
jgi:hypothetical protein